MLLKRKVRLVIHTCVTELLLLCKNLHITAETFF
jgi:hypothetical protein